MSNEQPASRQADVSNEIFLSPLFPACHAYDR